MFSISLNTSINRKHISDSSRAKRATRALSSMKKKQKRNNDDANDVSDVVDDFDAANEIEERNYDDELARNERVADKASTAMNDDEIIRRETNDDEDSFRDVFRDQDSALDKRKRI
jgi:hypothetical protein